MSETEEITFRCPHCGKENTVTFHRIIDADDRLREAVIDGSLFEYTCSSCGYHAALSADCIYLDRSRKLAVVLAENTEGHKSGKLLEEAGKLMDLSKCTVRVVSSPNELTEKILLKEEGIDDRIFELEKGEIRQQLKKEKPDLEIWSMLYSPDDGDGQIAILNSKGWAGSVPCNPALYEQLKAEVVPGIPDFMMNGAVIDADWADMILQKAPEKSSL